MRRWLTSALIFAFLLARHASAVPLYAAAGTAGGPGSLYRIDPATAAATLVGPITVGAVPVGVTGLAFDPLTGVLYGVTTTNSPLGYAESLIIIDPFTGNATLVGALGIGVADISFDSSGTLYGWKSLAGGLVKIDIQTGIATSIGAAVVPTPVGGGLAFDSLGTLYVAASGSDGKLRTVDPSTGATTDGPTMDGAALHTLAALAFDPTDVLFGADIDRTNVVRPANLVTVNVTSGHLVIIGALPNGTDALAFQNLPISLSRYFSHLDAGDSLINLTNDGSSGGNICANIYAFSPDEQLISCCACPITPDGLASLSVHDDLISNVLTPAVPTSITVKLIATTVPAGGCNAATVTTAVFPAGLHAWGTTLHPNPTVPPSFGPPTPSTTFAVTETPFTPYAADPANDASLCFFVGRLGSGFGICKSCQLGGLGAVRK